MKRLPWLVLVLLSGGIGTRALALLSSKLDLLPGCPFKRLTGMACATCGLTRCLVALGRWEWREAFHWHPAAAGAAVLLPVLAVWDARRSWRGDPYPPLPDSQAIRLAAWAALFLVWAGQALRGI